MFHAEVKDLTYLRDTITVANLELSLAEGRGHLVLHHLHTYHAANGLFAVLQRRDLADVEAYRCIELQGIAAGGGFRATEHHADLLAQLVDEDAGGVGLGNSGGHLAQGLTHQTGLQADDGVAHIALNLLLRRQGSHRVDYDDVDSGRADKLVGYLQCLLTIVGL